MDQAGISGRTQIAETDGKKILITGASRGIGLAAARLFAEEGYTVFANYRLMREPLSALIDQQQAKGRRIIPLQADVTKRDEVGRMFAEAGPLDVLINNAGMAQFKLFSEMSEADWDQMIEANLKSVFLCTRAAVPEMIRRQSGCIINLSSVWGVTGGSCEAHYSAAKAGVIGFSKALAKELAPSNIRVNCVAPGAIETDMTVALTAEDRCQLLAETPLCRLGTAEQVARTAYFLAEQEFMTGEVINLNGGLWI